MHVTEKRNQGGGNRRGRRNGRGTKAVKEHSAGGVVVRRMDEELYVLLIRDPYEKWGLPKGHIESGEGSMDAALREVSEETGLTQLVPGPSLGSIDWYFRFENRLIHKFCDYYLMASPQGDFTPEVAEGITECRWVPVAEVTEVVAYDNAREMVREAVRLIDVGEADPLLAEAFADA